MGSDLPPLEPLKEDVAYVSAHDPGFFANLGLDQKPPAVSPSIQNVPTGNPWAVGPGTAGTGFTGQHIHGAVAADYDDEDFYS